MTDDELKQLFESMRQENAAAHAETRNLTASAIAEMRQENAVMRQENAAAHAETRRYFDQKMAEDRRFFEVLHEGTKHEIGLIAEKVVRLEEKVDNVKNELEERMERGFAETQAMIKFSHAELDRRIRTLEEK